MDRNKKIILIIIAVVVMIGFGVKACCNHIGDLVDDWVSPNMNYENADYYSPASQCNLAPIAKDINVAWINGSITVKYAQQDSITWQEIYIKGTQNEHTMLHYWMDGHTLYINYFEANGDKPTDDEGWSLRWRRSGKQSRSMRNLCKDLEIVLPQDWALDNLTIHNVNGSITTEVDAQKIELGSVNGNKTVCAKQIKKIEMSTVNGSSTIKLPEQASWKAEFDKVNGGFSSEFPVEKEGDTYTSGTAPDIDIEVEAVNGSLNIEKL